MGADNQDPAPGVPAGRAWYGATIADFLREPPVSILGHLSQNSDFSDMSSQKDAWRQEIAILQQSVAGFSGSVFLEFSIPRMGRRIDTVLLIGPVVLAIEFKIGEQDFDHSAIEQVWDYALDLKNFHEASHGVHIVPILVASAASEPEPIDLHCDDDGVYRPIAVNATALRPAIKVIEQSIVAAPFSHQAWARAPYHPTPTIVEAARALYAQHSVEAIARHDAGAANLGVTSRRIEYLIAEAREKQRKVIIFVTGVPGAGKTLVGLNVATLHRRELEQVTHAVYLSGNGPLVAVLREALTRDEYARRKACAEKVRKGKIGESVKAFIQNVHHFRDEALVDSRPPLEHVVIFDEAQRAWSLKKTASFMQQKRKRAGFSQSEPEFLISCLERHSDWAAVICLVGGGQEIHTGEAGIAAWLDAIQAQFPHWFLHMSDRLTDSEYAAGRALERLRGHRRVQFDRDLHLATSMRSFRAENVSAFVKALLDCEVECARQELRQLARRYPIALTRDLARAKEWVRSHARGSERYGLVASSKAQRLKPHAIDIRVGIDPVTWFLNGRDDTRASYYLEDAATEFQVQGLELDWSCVTWDGDFRFTGSGWSHHDFRGDRWTRIVNPENRDYLRNAYRVLLTRARQGMVIFVPRGEPSDPTRAAEFYDPTFRYLASLGTRVLE